MLLKSDFMAFIDWIVRNTTFAGHVAAKKTDKVQQDQELSVKEGPVLTQQKSGTINILMIAGVGILILVVVIVYLKKFRK